MRNKILVIILFILITISVKSQIYYRESYDTFFSKVGYSYGIQVGGTTGFSGTFNCIYYEKIICPYVSTQIGVNGFESKFGILLYGTAEGQSHNSFRENIIPHLLACTLSINYSQLWTMENQKNLLLGFSKEKRSIGLELGLTFVGINYKIGCYKGKSNPFLTHTIGLFF